MKWILIILCFLCISLPGYGQEIGLQANYAGSSYNKFARNWGYGLEFNYHLNDKNRIGFLFQQSFCNLNYSEVYGDLTDGVSYLIRKTVPQNQRIAVKMNYAYKVIDKGIAGLYIGPEIGINYMIVKESVKRIENGGNSAANYSRDYSENNKFRFGLLIEFEIKEIIAKGLSMYLAAHPEYISYSNKWLVGAYNNPGMIRWMAFDLGFRYNWKH